MKRIIIVGFFLCSLFSSSNSFAKDHKLGLGEEKAVGMGNTFVSILFVKETLDYCFAEVKPYGEEKSFEKIRRTEYSSKDVSLGKLGIFCRGNGTLGVRVQPKESLVKEVQKSSADSAGPPIMKDNYPEDMSNVPIPPEMHFTEAPVPAEEPSLIIPPTGETITGMP
jgi:hypothetical protein